MIRLSVYGDDAVAKQLREMAPAVAAAIYAKLHILVLMIEAAVKRKLSGEVLNVGKNRPGHTGGALRASIVSKVEQLGNIILGEVFSSGDVPYAAIHEFGGHTGAHLIIPKRVHALLFSPKGGGEGMFRTKVDHPGSKIPERSYMRSTMEEMSNDISLGIKQSVIEAIQEKSR